jgi:hypothetical protein
MRSILVLLSIIFVACDSSSGDSEKNVSTASYKVDGVLITANRMIVDKPTSTNSSFQIFLQERDSDKNTLNRLGLVGESTFATWAGSYSNNDDDLGAGDTYAYFNDYQASGASHSSYGDGRYVISSATDERVTGTFSFKVATKAGAILTITEGKFDIYYD